MKSKIIISIVLLLIINKSFQKLNKKVISLTQDPEKNFFLTKIEIGEPPQTFEVQIDTTTSETWVPSSNTTYNVSPKYNSSLSSTAKETDKLIEVNDEEGDVSGNATYDKVKVGGLTIENFGFVQVLKYDIEPNFSDYPNGKLGLGYKKERGDDFSLIKKLKNNQLIDKEIFTINPITQELILGGYPSTPDFNISDVTYCNQSFTDDLKDDYRQGWVCELTHIFFGDKNQKTLNSSKTINSRVNFDSAYNYISAPKSFLKVFNNSLFYPIFGGKCELKKEEHEKYFICEKDEEKMEKFYATFVIGGYGYILKSSDLFEDIDNYTVKSVIRFQNEEGIFSFGKPFVDQFTIVYDYEENKLGFTGMDRKNYSTEWELWMKGQTPEQIAAKMKRLIIYSSIAGGIFLIIIIFIILKNVCTKSNDAYKLSEEYNSGHGPLVDYPVEQKY